MEEAGKAASLMKNTVSSGDRFRESLLLSEYSYNCPPKRNGRHRDENTIEQMQRLQNR